MLFTAKVIFVVFMWDDELMYLLYYVFIQNFESYFMMGVRQPIRYHMSDIFMIEQCSLMRRSDHTCLEILTGMRSCTFPHPQVGLCFHNML